MAKIEGVAPAQPMAKRWAWSYSKLKNYEVCPRRHYEVDLARTFVEKKEPGGPLDWGDRVHYSMARACAGTEELPAEMVAYQRWVDRVRKGPGQLLIEQKYAINDQFQPRPYFAPDVWYRGIGDIIRLHEEFALVLDWKTGKILEDSVQLMLMAQCIFSYYPQVQFIRSEFVWLKDDCSSPEQFTRKEVAEQWVTLMGRVNALEAAHTTQSYPARPNHLCKSYCPVASCPHWKKGR